MVRGAQEEVYMDTQFVSNIINSVVALAALAAVIVSMVAINQNRKQRREDWLHAQQLVTEERQHQVRPFVFAVEA